MTPAERTALYEAIMRHMEAWINRSVAQTLRRQRERQR